MKYFDNFAQEYDSWYKTPKGKFIDKIETKIAFKLLNPQPRQQILDIGCGTGIFSLKLASMDINVTAIDTSKTMIQIAKYKASLQNLSIDFKIMDALNLAFHDNKFDMAISITAIEFVKDKEKFVNEALRVVKPGGKVLICTINKDSDWGKRYKKEGESQESIYHGASFINFEELINIKPEQIINQSECLYIPIDAKANKFTHEEENKFKKSRKGGFICVLWQKK